MAIRKKITIANENKAGLYDVGTMDDGTSVMESVPDHVQPFMLDASRLRGRIVRLPTVIQDILTPHDYPPAVARIMAEGLCLTTLLAGMLKFDGIFTLQVKAEGVLRSLVCDITTDGTLRGYAGYNDADDMPETLDFIELTGPADNKGYLAFTVDQASSADRYQGIVALSGDSLTDSVQAYFRQSEQIMTTFHTQIGQDADGVWQGAAIMLQQMPEESVSANDDAFQRDATEESWRRSMMLLETIRPGEMLDMAVPLNTVLYRLFHEEGVRVFNPIAITKGCRCSAEKIAGVLDNLSDSDRLDYAQDGVISVTCEFCSTVYTFPPDHTT